MSWARPLKGVFRIDIEICRRCGARLRVIASIEAPAAIDRILGPKYTIHHDPEFAATTRFGRRTASGPQLRGPIKGEDGKTSRARKSGLLTDQLEAR
jgi:hypothetical protein